MEHKGRKPIYDDSLVIMSFSVRRDQRDYLRGLPNRSEWIRELIDTGIAKDTGNVELDIISITKRIAALERERTDLMESPQYKRAQTVDESIEFLSGFKQGLLDNVVYMFLSYHIETARLYVGGRMWQFNDVPGWTQEELEEFLIARGVECERESYTFKGEVAVTVIDRMLDAMADVKKIRAAYDKRINEYKAEIQALQNKIHDAEE